MMRNNIITLVIFMTSITIKGINDEIYRRFRALATLRGISIQKALEEAMVLWIKQGTILIDVGEIDAIMEYLRKNPAKPFVYDPSRGITVEANKEWARKKLGISNS